MEMYQRLGFTALGPPVASGEAEFVPMSASFPLPESVERLARRFSAGLGRQASEPASSSTGARRSDMFDPHSQANRRDFLRSASAAAGGALLAAPLAGALVAGERAKDSGQKLKVAAVITEFTYRSHAHVILENFLKPYLFNGKITDPGCDVVSLYVDQFPAGDMARKVAQDYKFTIYPTIAEALCTGGKQLAVDAVLSIGEHGNYPMNAKGQREYPRKRFFDEIVAVFRTSGRTAPVFSDKHLSYRWDWAKEMYDTARKMNFPLMAGSSVPLAERRPPLELPASAPIVEAVSIHGGGVESYDFHGLEVLQSMVEARRGGETGVAHVHFLTGEPLWKAADDGLWSPALAAAALAAEFGPDHELVKTALARGKKLNGDAVDAHAILLDYRDGLRGAALRLPTGGGTLALRLPIEGRRQAAGHELLRRPVGQPQPVQGPVARDPDALSRAPRTVPGRTDAVDHRRAGRGDGFARRRRQSNRYAAACHRLPAARLPGDARNGRDVEDHHRRHAATAGHRARADKGNLAAPLHTRRHRLAATQSGARRPSIRLGSFRAVC